MTGTDLMTLERQEQIVALVNEHGSITVAELSQAFGVSETTIRRDLATLATRNQIRRTHGGAMRVRPVVTTETPIIHRQQQHAAEKARIAEAAAHLVQDGETLLIAGGSTGLAFAGQLAHCQNLTVVTDSLLVVDELMRQGQHRVILLGGTIDPDEQATRGTLSRLVLEQLQVDKVIMGARAVSVSRGLSSETPEEAEFFRTSMKCGENVILITDSSKFRLSALAHLAPLEAIDCLVTDDGLDADTAEQIREMGIYLILV